MSYLLMVSLAKSGSAFCADAKFRKMDGRQGCVGAILISSIRLTIIDANFPLLSAIRYSTVVLVERILGNNRNRNSKKRTIERNRDRLHLRRHQFFQYVYYFLNNNFNRSFISIVLHTWIVV